MADGDSPIARDGKLLLLAMDHGLEHGPSDFRPAPETADPETVFEIATHDAVTGLAVGKGVAERYYPSYAESVDLVAKLNGASDLRTDQPRSARHWSVEYAAEVGADAVGYTLYPGSTHEPEMVEAFGAVQERARHRDLPVVLWSYPRGPAIEDETDPSVVAYASRIALELGADVAKVKHPGGADAMEWATQVAGDLAVVVSGGSRVGGRAFLENVRTALDGGAAGLAVGRNVWQRENPSAMLDALESLVFEDSDVETAVDALE